MAARNIGLLIWLRWKIWDIAVHPAKYEAEERKRCEEAGK
jgi:hypothetical protein